MSDYPSADYLIQQAIAGHIPLEELVEQCLVGDYEDSGFSNLLVGHLQSQGVRIFRNERFMPGRGISTFVCECLTREPKHYKIRVESVDGLPVKCHVRCSTTKYKKNAEGSPDDLFETICNAVLRKADVAYSDLTG